LRFLHVSTDEVYGTLGPKDPAFTEETPFAPNSPYAASKAASDHFVRSYQHTFKLPTLTTNCSNNYGPYHFPEKLIPLMILNALEGKPLPVYGDGIQIRDLLYLEDHRTAIRPVLHRGPHRQPGRGTRPGVSDVEGQPDENQLGIGLHHLGRRAGHTSLDVHPRGLPFPSGAVHGNMGQAQGESCRRSPQTRRDRLLVGVLAGVETVSAGLR